MALRFKLFGIPVEIQLWFGLTILLLHVPVEGLSKTQTLPIWALVVFVGVLAHEMGHALAARRFGMRPRVIFSAFFGLTQFRGGGVMLTPLRSMAVSAAGPAAGLLLGALAIPLALQSPANPLVRAGLEYWLWVNLGWSVLNLLPILPLDGGHIMASGFRMVAPKKGGLVARYVSLVIIGLGIAFAFAFEQTFAGLFLAFFAFVNFQALKAEKELASREVEIFRTPEDLKLFAYQALERGEVPAVLRAGTILLRVSGEDAQLRDEAIHLVAWARLLGGEPSLARTTLDELSGERAADPALEGAVQLALGRTAEALDLFERALDESGASEFVEKRYLQAAEQLDAGERVAAFAAAHPGILASLSERPAAG